MNYYLLSLDSRFDRMRLNLSNIEIDESWVGGAIESSGSKKEKSTQDISTSTIESIILLPWYQFSQIGFIGRFFTQRFVVWEGDVERVQLVPRDGKSGNRHLVLRRMISFVLIFVGFRFCSFPADSGHSWSDNVSGRRSVVIRQWNVLWTSKCNRESVFARPLGRKLRANLVKFYCLL